MATKGPLDRNNEADARRIIEAILPSEPIRRACLGLLSDLIDCAHALSSGGWALTLQEKGIRLNVGPIEVFTLYRGEPVRLHVMLDAESFGVNEQNLLVRSGVELYGPPVYRSVPNSIGAECPVSDLTQGLSRILEVLEPSAIKLVEVAAGKRASGRSLWWFAHSRGAIRYIGEFLGRDVLQPFFDAPAEAEPAVEIQEIPIEDQNVDFATVAGTAEPHDAEFRERSLVIRYVGYLRARGVGVNRYRINLPGDGGVLFCDAWDAHRRNLLEAKGEITRDSIRMAIGQLADYGRFLEPSRSAVLLPERPSRDLEDLLGSAEIGAVWENADGQFEDNSDGCFI